MRFFKLIIVFFIFITSVFYAGDQKKKDSLNLLRYNPNIHDTTYINYSYELSKYYIEYPDSLDSIVNESLELSTKIKYKKGLYSGNLILVDNYKKKGEYQIAFSFIDKALKFTENQIETYFVLSKKADIYFYFKENELVIETYQTILKLAEENKNLKKKSYYLNKLANFYYQIGNIKACIESIEKAIEVVELTNDTSNTTVLSYNNLGIIYQQQNDFESALSVFRKALLFVEKYENKNAESEIYNNIASIYKKKTKKNKEKIKDSLLLLSLENLLISKEIKELNPTKSSNVENTYSNLGYIYSELNQLENARLYNQKALTIRELNKDKRGLASSYFNLGKVNYKLGALDSAKYYLEQGFELANEIGKAEQIKKTSKLLSIVYEELDLVTLALKMSRIHEEMKDSLVNEGTQKAMLNQQLKYKYEKQKILFDAENKIAFSGAYNPLWIVREKENLTDNQKKDRKTVIDNDISLIEIPANRQPVGLSSLMKDFE